MENEPDNLVLSYLRRMDAKLDGIDNKLGAAVIHISAIEHGLAGLKADFATMQASMHSIDRRLDKIEDHIERVTP